MNPQVSVDVKSAWLSKINWTQGVAGAAMVIAYFSGGKINLSLDQQAALVVSIGVIGNVVTWVIKTWFTSTITPPSATQAPIVTATIPTAAVKTIALFAILIIGTLIVATPGHAQSKPGLHAPTGNVIQDAKDLVTPAGPGGIIGRIEAKQGTDIANFLMNLASIPDAITLSTQIPGLQDPVGNACWQQFGPIGELIKVHPLVFTGKAAPDLEALRLAAIGLNQICANPNCGQMFVDATNAASAIAGNPLNISLQSLCAKVPVIGTSAVPTTVVPTGGIGTAPAISAPPKP